MRRILGKIRDVGLVTEAIPRDQEYEKLGTALKRGLDRHFRGSLAIRALDAGSCNACELEIQALNNPYYDVERFGVHFVASPRHADVLMVTGVQCRHMEAAVRRTYAAMAEPKWVIAVGDCAVDGGLLGINYASLGPIATVLPVDLTIPGCPPSPLHLIKGLLALMTMDRPGER